MKTLCFAILLLACYSCSQKKDTSQRFEQPEQSEMPSLADSRIIDLTYDLSDETVFWVTAREFELEVVASGMTEKGYYYAANNFCMAEHGGTHIDAPIHFSENGQTVDEVPLEQLIGQAIKIDVSDKAQDNPNYLISIEDLQHWEEINGKIPDSVIVLLQTGFATYYPDKKKYLGTEERGEDAVRNLHFPGLAPEAAKWLAENRNIKSIGIDTPSIDYGQSQEFKSHVILLGQNIPAFENVANMDLLPEKGFQVIALPIKIKGGSGGPLRIIALTE